MNNPFKRHAKVSTPRGVRPELPSPFPSSTALLPGRWGDAITQALRPIHDGQIFGLPAAWRCVNLIANGVASMSPMDVYAPDGITKIPSPSVVARPLATMNTFDFWHMAVSTALMRGNFYGLLADFDATGYPQQVVPIHNDFVTVYIDGSGYTVYNIGGEFYSADEMVHVRGFTIPNHPRGLGVVENFRRSLGQHLDQQNMVADTYQSGSVPPGVINLDRSEVDKAQADAVQSQWITGHGAGLRRPAVLPKTMTFTPIAWSPEDMQFLQARHMSVAETAFVFNLDPSDLGANVGGTSLTYANIEQREIARVTDAYGPWMRRFEQAWSDLIPGGNLCEFNPSLLLRTDEKTRAEVHVLNIGSGVESVNEARAAERRGPWQDEPDAEDETEPAAVTPSPTAPSPSAAPVVNADGSEALPADVKAAGPAGTDMTVKPLSTKK